MNHKPMKMLIALLLVCALLVSHLPIVSVFAVDGDQIAQTEPDGAAEASLSETQATAESAETASTQPETQPETQEAETEPTVAPERSAEETGAEAASVQPARQEEAEQYALDQTVMVDGVAIRLTAADGVFPEGARLEAKRAGVLMERMTDVVVRQEREADCTVASSYTFDIKVLDQEGNELQPADENLVRVSFSLAEVENQNLDVCVYHIKGDTAETMAAESLPVETEGDTATVETDGFSFYTVEFTYGDKEYVLQGGRYVRLYDILNFVGLTGEVEAWEISNNELFTILRGDETGIREEYEWVGDDEIATPVDDPNGTVLYMISLQAFDTEEWLKVTIDGIEYEIVVTDDNTTQNVPPDQYDSTGISTNLDGTLSMGVGADGKRDEYIHNATTPDYVKQSKSTTSATDFAAGLPLSTIFIDVGKIGHASNKGVQGEFTLLTENPAILAGFEHSYSTTGGDVVRYNPTLDTDNLMQIEPNKINVLAGDLFQFVYKDAAILPNGDKAHLRIVYSNAKIAIDQRLGVTDAATGLTPSNYQGAIKLATGASAAREGTDYRYLGTKPAPDNNGTPYTNPFTEAQRQAMLKAVNDKIQSNWGGTGQIFTNSNANTADTPAVGESIDIKYQIVDDAGNPVNGTFIFAMTGINLDRDPYAETGNNVCKPLWSHTADDPHIHFFSEAVSINSGIVSDYIYVRPNTPVFESTELQQAGQGGYKYNYYYSHVIIDENGKPKFIGNSYREGYGGDDKSYNSGFVLLVNATEGITITSTGHGSGRHNMNTQAYGGVQIWYRYTSYSGPNGNIQTTSEGNYGGTLNDTSDSGVSSNILEPNTYVVPEGKTVVYTMTPNDGFQIARLEVENTAGVMVPQTYDNQPLSTMQPGDVLKFDDAAGRECTLTAVADGEKIKFILEMPYAQHDETVHVYWERTQAKVTVKKETVDNQEGSFRFKIKAHKKEDEVSYAPVEVGSLWLESGNYSNDFKNGASCSMDADELASKFSDITLMETVTLPSDTYNYRWGAKLWKTNVRLSDLGITYGDKDDVLFVGFQSVSDARAGDTLDYALRTGYSATGPERVYFYYPGTTIIEDVVTYWNFETEDGQSDDPGWYEFTLNNGGEREFLIQQKYEYEVYEETQTGWELVSVDGVFGARKAMGYLSEETHSAPEHIFKNRKLPDLKIEKTTENDAPGSFDFIVKLTQAAVPAQSYQLTATAVVENGVIRYTFTNNGTAFSVNGMVIPAGETTYVDGTLSNSVFVKLLNLSSASTDTEKKITLGTEAGTVSTAAAQSLKSWAEDKKTAQIAALNAGTRPDIDGPESVQFTFVASGKDERPYDFGDTLPTGVSKVDAGDLSKGYKVTVSSGTPFTLLNLPHGVSYEVVETLPPRWEQLSRSNDTGNLTDDTTAGFRNRRYLDLKIAKTLVGNQASRDKYFKFTVKLEGCISNSKLTLDMTKASQAPGKTVATAYEAAAMAEANGKDDDSETDGQQISVDGEGKAQFSVYLQHGQSILIQGIPYGASYTVTEVPEDYQPTLKFDGDDHTGDSATEEGTAIVIGTYNGEPGASDSFLKADTTLTVKNVRNGVVPTGVETGSLAAPGMMLLLTGALMSLLWLGRRRLDDG